MPDMDGTEIAILFNAYASYTRPSSGHVRESRRFNLLSRYSGTPALVKASI